MDERDNRPIGIFDSGVGGLTVLQALIRQFPNESFIYLGDTARVPYGSKSARTIERYTIQVAQALLNRSVKLLVVACNTASALGLTALRRYCPTPAIGVIEPGCRLAAATSQQGRIGVIATRSTIASQAYRQTLADLDSRFEVHSLACPLFVPLVEEGWHDHPATRLVVESSLQPLQHSGIDTLILGCTHYPLLRPVIQEVIGPTVRLIDSASAVAATLANLPTNLLHRAAPDAVQSVTFLVTDVADRFREVAHHFLHHQVAVDQVEMIDL
ncbi:MAG: glutamate racemase [Magnetococcales bacterium]|nr:glutamate racemase [Magnetococcales bacterium]